jgi:zinc/manganese transport system substrate-binding protein
MFQLMFAWMAPVASAEVNVVATVPTLATVAREIVGEHGKVTSLSVHTQDPHFVDARPNLALALARADLLLLTGIDLEIGWLPTLLVGSRNSKIQAGSTGYLDCSRHVRLLQVPTTAVDRSMGDIHPGGNPHYHVDPRAMRSLAPVLAERLGQLDPEHASVYTANAQHFVATLDQQIPQWEARAASLKGAKVIDFHRSWPYAADWLGFQIVEDIEPKPGIPPTPKHILHVLEVARAQQVKVILQESWFPSTVSQTVADQAGAKLVVLDAQADFQGGQTYVQHVDELVGALTGSAP